MSVGSHAPAGRSVTRALSPQIIQALHLGELRKFLRTLNVKASGKAQGKELEVHNDNTIYELCHVGFVQLVKACIKLAITEVDEIEDNTMSNSLL